MNKKSLSSRLRLALKIILSISCVLWVGFIFSNSLRPATQSSEQSSTVVEIVQAVAQVIAPDSKIATATGEDYEQLHRVVRKLAHFTEFAVLGVLLCWCYFAYTTKIKRIWISALGVFVVPAIDETIQLFVSGRAGTITDFLIDSAGGASGFAVAWGIVLLAQFIRRKRQRKKENENREMEDAGTEFGNCVDQVQQENLV